MLNQNDSYSYSFRHKKHSTLLFLQPGTWHWHDSTVWFTCACLCALILLKRTWQILRPLLEKQHTRPGGGVWKNSSTMQRGGRGCGGRAVAMLFYCFVLFLYASLKSWQKHKKAEAGWWQKGMRSEILPRSPAQSTVLFSSGRGGGRRREESINDRASTLELFVSNWGTDLSGPLLRDKRKTNTHWFLAKSQSKKGKITLICFSVIRLVEWNNLELQWINHSWARLLQIQSFLAGHSLPLNAIFRTFYGGI